MIHSQFNLNISAKDVYNNKTHVRCYSFEPGARLPPPGQPDSKLRMTFKIAGFPSLLLPVSAGAQRPVRGQLVQPSHDARFVELELRSWISALRSAAQPHRERTPLACAIAVHLVIGA